MPLSAAILIISIIKIKSRLDADQQIQESPMNEVTYYDILISYCSNVYLNLVEWPSVGPSCPPVLLHQIFIPE